MWVGNLKEEIGKELEKLNRMIDMKCNDEMIRKQKDILDKLLSEYIKDLWYYTRYKTQIIRLYKIKILIILIKIYKMGGINEKSEYSENRKKDTKYKKE